MFRILRGCALDKEHLVGFKWDTRKAGVQDCLVDTVHIGSQCLKPSPVHPRARWLAALDLMVVGRLFPYLSLVSES